MMPTSALTSVDVPPGFNRSRWRQAECASTELPWQAVAQQVRRSSADRMWRGLRVWHQVGPAGDLYVPPHDLLTIIVRRSTPTSLLQRHGMQMGAGAWHPGTAVIVPPGLPSFWRTTAARDNVHVNLDPAWLQRAGGDGCALPSCFGRPDPVLHAFANMLLTALDTNTSLQPAFAEHLAQALAIHLLEHYAVPTARRTAGLNRREMDRLADAVDASLGEKWPIERMAALVCLSPFHFARAFKAAFGMTPHAYVSERRILAAARLIRSGSTPLQQIAIMTGHASATHFSQAFRRHWGMTPLAFRLGH